MNSIRTDLKEFADALTSGQFVECNKEGKWFIESNFKHKIRWLFRNTDERVLKVSQAFIGELDALERIPVNVGSGTPEKKEAYALYLSAAEAVAKHLESHWSEAVEQQFNALKLRITGLKYRIEKGNGGLEVAASENSLEDLKKLALEWKEGYPLYEIKTLSKEELIKLDQASKYSEFVEHLKVDKPLNDLFFKWLLRDNNEADLFVQFPSVAVGMKSTFIAARLGRLAPDFNFIKKVGDEKHVFLPFELQEKGSLVQREICVLDENATVNLRGDFQLTIKQVIDLFEEKKVKPGKLEFLNGSIRNWHSHKFGWWNPAESKYETIDLSPEKKNWWEQLPIFETITKEDVKKRYGLETVEAGKWVAVVRSSREFATLDVDKCHGFFEILIPNTNGDFNVYPLGKFAAKFPQTLADLFLFITGTREARIQYPDENAFYAQRQQAASPVVLDPLKAIELMEEIKKDIRNGKEGNMVFQFAWENCAWWPQKKLNHLLGAKERNGTSPNYFKKPLAHATPSAQPLKGMLAFVNKVSDKLQRIAIRFFEFLLLSWRKFKIKVNGLDVMKSVSTSGHMKNFEIFHPAALHHRIRKGKIKGIVTMGHLFVPQ